MNGVAISGRAGAGKSRLAAEFTRLGYDRHAFADALKDEVRWRFGLVKTDPGGRDKLIEWGEGRRAQDPYYWIDRLVNTVRSKLGTTPVVIDDLRTRNEAAWCRTNGFLLVRVEAPLYLRRSRLAEQGLDPNFALSLHRNETELERWPYEWDAVVQNDRRCRLAQAASSILALGGVGQFTPPDRRLLLPLPLGS